MRLPPNDIDTIRRILRRHFGDGAMVRLFGSRTIDSKRGGDIDILVESELTGEEAFRRKLEALSDLQWALGDQKIDLITACPADTGQAVVAEARKHGVRI